MDLILNYINSNFIQITQEKIKIITFIWEIVKCTILFAVCVKLTVVFSEKLFKHIIERANSHERKSQFATIKTLAVHTLEGLISIVYLLNILFLFGIDVRPILAGAGVMGIAIGFGAKRAVEDVINGLKLLFEGQIRVGDYVSINGMEGNVEKITLNLITIRSISTGAVYFIRTGSVDTVTNYTMQYSYAFFALDVAYRENIDHVIRTLKQAYSVLVGNSEYKKLVLGDIEIFGLDEFRESSLCVKCRIKTRPKGQWTIKRAFNKIIKEQFDNEGIEIPFKQITVTGAIPIFEKD